MKIPSDTRQKILDLLRVKGPSTAASLVKPLKITISAVRQQLAILETDGFIRPQRSSDAKQRGRPQLIYHLTDASEDYFTKTYASLALEILEDLAQENGYKGLKDFLQKRKQRMLRKHKAALKKSQQQDKLAVIAQTQDEAGYMATIKNEGKLKVIQEHNCPFIEVAKAYPEFCEIERQVYEELLKQPIQLETCRARGAQVCRFCVESPTH